VTAAARAIPTRSRRATTCTRVRAVRSRTAQRPLQRAVALAGPAADGHMGWRCEPNRPGRVQPSATARHHGLPTRSSSGGCLLHSSHSPLCHVARCTLCAGSLADYTSSDDDYAAATTGRFPAAAAAAAAVATAAAPMDAERGKASSGNEGYPKPKPLNHEYHEYRQVPYTRLRRYAATDADGEDERARATEVNPFIKCNDATCTIGQCNMRRTP
jgi:hypothetical protein